MSRRTESILFAIGFVVVGAALMFLALGLVAWAGR